MARCHTVPVTQHSQCPGNTVNAPATQSMPRQHSQCPGARPRARASLPAASTIEVPALYRLEKLDICLTVGCATVPEIASRPWHPSWIVPATRWRPSFATSGRPTLRVVPSPASGADAGCRSRDTSCPRFAQHHAPKKIRSRHKRGSGAPKRQRSSERRIQPRCRARPFGVSASQCLSGTAARTFGALACRRSAAALARALTS